jgi:hypothetical protein
MPLHACQSNCFPEVFRLQTPSSNIIFPGRGTVTKPEHTTSLPVSLASSENEKPRKQKCSVTVIVAAGIHTLHVCISQIFGQF